MSFTEIKQALGSWSLRLRADAPRELLDALDPFGHIAVAPGRLDPTEVGDNLLAAARYVGVYRGRTRGGDNSLKGTGMAFWLGDEDGKGDVLTTAVTLSGATFANAIRALLPAGGAITEGTLHSVPGAGTYTGTHQWETPRKAITYVCDTFSTDAQPVSWRVNGDGTLDAGPDADLYVTDPTALLVRRNPGREIRLSGLTGSMKLDTDVEDYTTGVVLLAQGEGASTVTATASNPTTFKDVHGNDVVLTRLVSESTTEATNAAARAQLQLNRFTNPRYAVDLSTDAYDVKGDFVVGDRVLVYDPDAGFVDLDREVTWRGQPINPIALTVIEMTWPLPAGWTCAFRRTDGTWLDLSDYVVPEGGSTTVKVGEFSRSLSGIGGEAVGTRPNGDTSTPATPVLADPTSVAYQSAAANDVRAAVYLTWAEPLNADGSTVLDGDHYEIRYRSTRTFNYPITWDQAHGFTWDELQTWGRPLSNPAAVADQWITAYVGWDSTELTVPELMVAAEYEFQIRAVDGASPPNQSPWSASKYHTTHTDTLAPETPAAPTVASSRLGIQVTHTLGAASGGTFNLAQDLHHLEVHVGGPMFFPDANTQVGSLVANAGHLAAGTPVVGTFQVENVDDLWVKVVAVDRFGNRSSPSAAVQASVDLIDSAHISDLTASKITAGTISADLLLGASIRTATEGQRAELNQLGLQLYDADGDLTVNLTADDSATNFVTIHSGATPVASISDTGVGSFQSLTVANDDVEINGVQLSDRLAAQAAGILAFGLDTTTSHNGNGTERGIFEVAFEAPESKYYQVSYGAWLAGPAGGLAYVQLRDGGSDKPTTSSPLVIWTGHGFTGTGIGEKFGDYAPVYFTAGTHRLLLSYGRYAGSTGTFYFSGSAMQPAYIQVMDTPAALANLAIANDGGTGGGTVAPVQTYTTQWGATWSGSYNGSNGFVSYYGNEVHQGYYSSSNGNQRGLIGFDSASIMSTLSGATILGCSVTMYAFHWYPNSGGTAVIGTHGHSGRPGTFSATTNRIQSAGWPKPGLRTVDLGVGIGQEFQAGSTKGVALGPGPSTAQVYYGKFYGAGQSSAPVLSITYQK